jgi:23S rRNA (adenine2030-N6)-methyltransferase
MLSYQHSYHAGNAADVHKHLALVCLLQQLRQKEAPFCYIDTHAGRGLYDLHSEEALKTGEAQSGVHLLLTNSSGNLCIQSYRDAIMSFNCTGNTLQFYPGSAALAQHFLREQDRAILMEAHPQEYAALRRNLGRDKHFALHQRDAYEGLPALVPPAIKRGLVLLDPSYENKQEFEGITQLIEKAARRWSNAIYMLWYPLLKEARHKHLLRRLQAAGYSKTLRSEFIWDSQATGMHGSGLFVINTPWQFGEQFSVAMTEVQTLLAGGQEAGHHLQAD